MRSFLALITTSVLLTGLLAAPVFATGDDSQVISAKALDDHQCDSSEWHFVITQVKKSPPESITVEFSGGDVIIVPLNKISGQVAHYVTTANLDEAVVAASTEIYGSWSGQFNLSHGPCDEAPPPTTPPPPPVPAVCTLQTHPTVVFDRLYSPGKGQSESTKPVDLEAGTWKVYWNSYDESHLTYPEQVQKYEQFTVVLNGIVLGTTPDLPEDRHLMSGVFGEFELDAATSVSAIHVPAQDGTKNSIEGCIAFVKVDVPPETTTTTVPETTTTTLPETTTTTVPEPTTTTVPEPKPEPEPIEATAGATCELVFAETTGPATVYLSYTAEGREEVSATEIISEASGSSVELVVQEADLNRDLVWDVLVETVDGQTITASGEEECSEPTPTTTPPTTAPPTTAPPSTLPTTGTEYDGAAIVALIALLSGTGLVYLTRKTGLEV